MEFHAVSGRIGGLLMTQYLSFSLDGVDGSHWDLAGPGAGAQGVTFRPGPSKLIDAPAKTFWIQSATGMHYQGRQFQRRDPVFSVQIHHRDPDVWRDIDSRFRMALGMYDDEFTLNCETPDGIRHLKMRLLSEPTAYGTADYEGRDPHIWADSTLAISAAASQPFWFADDLTFSWALPSGTSGSTTFPMQNLGDVDVWVKWFINAPSLVTLPDYSWGSILYNRASQDATRTVALPTLVAGEDLSVDSDPDQETLIAANGSPVWNRWAANGILYPIAPKTLPTNVPVTMTGANPGAAVKLTMPRRYSRPFGVSL